MVSELSSKDLEALGLQRRTVQQWADHGFVTPSLQKGDGPGSRHAWSPKDAGFMLAFQAMIASGFSRELAADILKKGLA